MRATLLICAISIALPSCGPADPNLAPSFGEKTGLPKNCRAIIQTNIDAWRSGEHTTEDVMDSMERNCGAHGHSWGQ